MRYYCADSKERLGEEESAGERMNVNMSYFWHMKGKMRRHKTSLASCGSGCDPPGALLSRPHVPGNSCTRNGGWQGTSGFPHNALLEFVSPTKASKIPSGRD